MSGLVKAKDHVDEIDSDEEEETGKGPVEEPQVEEDTTLANPDVVTKYQEAAKITQAALQEVAAMCVPGARIVDICKAGDEIIESKCATIYKNKNKAGKYVLKGVAFPVCVSVNECVCHCSPLLSDASYAPLQDDDMVKIDLGVHIDGYIVLSAHTLLVGQDLSNASVAATIQTGDRANVMNATYVAAEVAAKLIKAGNTNAMVTDAIKQVADAYGVSPISGTLMHQMKQFVIDGNKMILLKDEPEQKVEACTFEKGEVYAIDIAMSTGEGKPRELGNRTTVYKRNVDRKYSLKNKSSRAFFNDVNKRFPTLPFSVRALPDEQGAKMGVRECVNHELLQAYPVLHERKGDFVAHVKFTVLLLPSGTLQVSGLPPPTFNAMCTTGVISGEGVPLTGGNIGNLLTTPIAGTEKEVALPDSIKAILLEVKPENKKKAKKAAAAAAKKAAAAAKP